MHVIEVAKLVLRNPQIVRRSPTEVTQAARRASDTVRAMRDFREYCEEVGDWLCWYCEEDEETLHIHHVEPVSVAPEKAHLWDNMAVLCASCHLHVAHAGSWLRYQPKILEILTIRGPLIETESY